MQKIEARRINEHCVAPLDDMPLSGMLAGSRICPPPFATPVPRLRRRYRLAGFARPPTTPQRCRIIACPQSHCFGPAPSSLPGMDTPAFKAGQHVASASVAANTPANDLFSPQAHIPMGSSTHVAGTPCAAAGHAVAWALLQQQQQHVMCTPASHHPGAVAAQFALRGAAVAAAAAALATDAPPTAQAHPPAWLGHSASRGAASAGWGISAGDVPAGRCWVAGSCAPALPAAQAAAVEMDPSDAAAGAFGGEFRDVGDCGPLPPDIHAAAVWLQERAWQLYMMEYIEYKRCKQLGIFPGLSAAGSGSAAASEAALTGGGAEPPALDDSIHDLLCTPVKHKRARVEEEAGSPAREQCSQAAAHAASAGQPAPSATPAASNLGGGGADGAGGPASQPTAVQQSWPGAAEGGGRLSLSSCCGLPLSTDLTNSAQQVRTPATRRTPPASRVTMSAFAAVYDGAAAAVLSGDVVSCRVPLHKKPQHFGRSADAPLLPPRPRPAGASALCNARAPARGGAVAPRRAVHAARRPRHHRRHRPHRGAGLRRRRRRLAQHSPQSGAYTERRSFPRVSHPVGRADGHAGVDL